MPVPVDDPDEMRRARQESLDEILDSDADRKVVVGGPGSGKTYTFGELIEQRPDDADIQVLTFINLLVEDLRDELPDHVKMDTFHAYCRRVLHSSGTTDLGTDFEYYPPLLSLVAEDFDYQFDVDLTSEDIEEAFHVLNQASGIPARALDIGGYYGATSFDDSVYRAVTHLSSNPDEIPSHDLVIVDEYQDFNKMETEFLELLSRKNSIVMAGDDDQALYVRWRRSDPRFLRDRVSEDRTEAFELPYCSRCPEPIVDAVNLAVERAQQGGHLTERIDKTFECFTPDKREDSERHPKIVHARCSVERPNAPYMGKYIYGVLQDLSEGYIETSRTKGHPTALVIGPKPFRGNVYKVLDRNLPGVEIKRSSKIGISLLDGLDLIFDDPTSRLGWRIILHIDPPDNVQSIIQTALDSGTELVDLLPAEYQQRYADLATVFGKIRDNLPIRDEERVLLATETGIPPEELKDRIEEIQQSGSSLSLGEDLPEGEPTVLCTSLVGAKGLSAEIVFLVGMNNNHLPRNPANPSNQMIRCFLVGLSRTRRECHLVSCKWLGGSRLRLSTFIDWIDPVVRTINVNKEFFES